MTWPWIAGTAAVAAIVAALVAFARYLNSNLSEADMGDGPADRPEDTEDWRNAP